ncbi:MAG: protein kinase [Phycisphaerae bacterium]|jgi:serine/threonine protein kinase
MCAQKGNKPMDTVRVCNQRPSYVLARLRKLRVDLGLTQDDLATLGHKQSIPEISRTTVVTAESGKPVGPKTVRLLVEKLNLILDEPLSIADLVGAGESESRSTVINQWRCIGPPEPYTVAPNGLQWRVQKLEHRHVRNRVGRGKFYDLSHLSSKHQYDFQGYLVARHAEVCDRVGAHLNIARNYGVMPDGTTKHCWWVVDEWIEGERLDRRIERGPLPLDELRQLMVDVALGLEALHKADVIRRELSPRFIFLTKSGAILTDFELAKLLDGSPTVATDEWPDDPYRAPEVYGGKSQKNSDLFSWAMIVAHAASGDARLNPGSASRTLDAVGLPAKVRRVAKSCLQPASKRPGSVGAVLKVLRIW